MRTTIDWPNHLINFVLVIGSILLAFQLDRCASDRREDRIVAAHLDEIREETAFNLRQIEPTIAGMKANVASLDSLLYLINNTEETAAINARMMQLLAVRPLYLKTTAYTSLTTSGDIRFVDDFDLKRNLTNLYEYYGLTDVLTGLLMDTYNDDYFEYIQQELDLQRARPQPIEKYRVRRFVNGISSYRYFTANCLRNYRDTQTRMQRFLEGEEVGGEL